MTKLKRRTVGHLVWITLLGFSLLVVMALDCFLLYMVCIREVVGWAVVGAILWCGFSTRTVWITLRIRLWRYKRHRRLITLIARRGGAGL